MGKAEKSRPEPARGREDPHRTVKRPNKSSSNKKPTIDAKQLRENDIMRQMTRREKLPGLSLDLRFRSRNPRPRYPYYAKGLDESLSLSNEALAKYQTTSVELSHSYAVHVENDLGIMLAAVDPDAVVDPFVSSLSDADRALTEADTAAAAASANRPERGAVSWLRRTEYLTNESRSSSSAQKQAAAEALAVRSPSSSGRLDRGEKVKAIEDSFALARQSLQHPIKKDLCVKRIRTLLPHDVLLSTSATSGDFAYVEFKFHPREEAAENPRIGINVRFCGWYGDGVPFMFPGVLDNTVVRGLSFVVYRGMLVEEQRTGDVLYMLPSSTSASRLECVRPVSITLRGDDAKEGTFAFVEQGDQIRILPIEHRMNAAKVPFAKGSAQRVAIENRGVVLGSVDAPHNEEPTE